MPTRVRGFSWLCLHILKLSFTLRKGWQKVQRKTDNTHAMSSTTAESLSDRLKRKKNPERNWARKVLSMLSRVSSRSHGYFYPVLRCSFDKHCSSGLNQMNLSLSSQQNEAESHWIRQIWAQILGLRLRSWEQASSIGACYRVFKGACRSLFYSVVGGQKSGCILLGGTFHVYEVGKILVLSWFCFSSFIFKSKCPRLGASICIQKCNSVGQVLWVLSTKTG